jgi:hypothetical protein
MAAEVGLVLALTQVETVGLWVGLVSAIVSIVLSIVAIGFARDVDRRSMEISHQTIRSLEAIQSTVQRLSDDTGGLIKVAWERMLGSMGSGPPVSNGELETMLAGLLQEFRQDADDLAPGTGIDKLAREVSKRMQRAAGRKNGADRVEAPKSWAFNTVVQAVESLSPLAIELLRTLSEGRHLSRTEYQQLRQDPELALAVDELRDSDLLMPFQRRGKHGEETIYGLAPWFQAAIGPALVFTEHETPSAPEAERVATALARVGQSEVMPAAVSG